MRTIVLLVLATLTGVPLSAAAILAGDVSISASSDPNTICAECPGDMKGTKLCYDVSLAANAEATVAKDFHLKTQSANAADFACCTTEVLVDANAPLESGGGEMDSPGDDWTCQHGSQVEDGENRHYMSWDVTTDNTDDNFLDRGETYRFCFVYCASDSDLDNSIEFVLTNDGTPLPAVPDASGDRTNVPDTAGGGDDPAWEGKITKAAGSKVGFAVSLLVPTMNWIGLAVLASAAVGVLGWYRRSRT